MGIGENLLEVREYSGSGYKPLVDFGAWRVAVLRYEDKLLPENIASVQRHEETDEVFVLLAGKCILFLCDGGDGSAGSVHGVDMEPLKLYNVKKSAWHSHTLSLDAAVLIVENMETTHQNSPFVGLDAGQRRKVVELARVLWGE